jgi:hypothetical protein
VPPGERVAIPLSKGALGLLVVGAAVFVGLATMLWYVADTHTRSASDAFWLRVMAVLTAGFFGLAGGGSAS